jgi:hypothetical protein
MFTVHGGNGPRGRDVVLGWAEHFAKCAGKQPQPPRVELECRVGLRPIPCRSPRLNAPTVDGSRCAQPITLGTRILYSIPQTDNESSEDGFNPDTSRSTAAAFPLPYYHSADENEVGNINLSELTRVTELYNYLAGSVRTGAYSPAVGTEDGFQPGP